MAVGALVYFSGCTYSSYCRTGGSCSGSGWLLMCFMDAPCVLLVRNLGPCLQAAGISYYFFGLGVR